jgi:hypothetical protein
MNFMLLGHEEHGSSPLGCLITNVTEITHDDRHECGVATANPLRFLPLAAFRRALRAV